MFRPPPGVTVVFTDIDDTLADFTAVTSGSHFGEEIDWTRLDMGALNEDHWTRLDMGVLNEDQLDIDFSGIVPIPIRNGDFFDLEITAAPAPPGVALFLGGGFAGRRRRS